MTEARNRFVYGIFEIEDGKETPAYIGMGKEDRMHSHLKAARRGDRGSGTLKDLYLIDAVYRGVEFIERKIIENLTLAEAREHEARLIKEIGCLEYGTGPLLNIRDGAPKGWSRQSQAHHALSNRTKQLIQAANEYCELLEKQERARQINVIQIEKYFIEKGIKIPPFILAGMKFSAFTEGILNAIQKSRPPTRRPHDPPEPS
jgi:hypothetical protein